MKVLLFFYCFRDFLKKSKNVKIQHSPSIPIFPHFVGKIEEYLRHITYCILLLLTQLIQVSTSNNKVNIGFVNTVFGSADHLLLTNYRNVNLSQSNSFVTYSLIKGCSYSCLQSNKLSKFEMEHKMVWVSKEKVFKVRVHGQKWSNKSP